MTPTTYDKALELNLAPQIYGAFAEIGVDDWSPYVRQDPKFFRPAEVDLLIGDAAKAREKLGRLSGSTLRVVF